MLPGHSAPLQIAPKAKARGKAKAKASNPSTTRNSSGGGGGGGGGGRKTAADEQLRKIMLRCQVILQQQQCADKIAEMKQHVLQQLEASEEFGGELSQLRSLIAQRFDSLEAFSKESATDDTNLDMQHRWEQAMGKVGAVRQSDRGLSPASARLVDLVNDETDRH